MNRDRGRDARRVVVIGLGRFGTSAARNLHELGYEVMAIDIGEKQVAEASGFVTMAAQGDGTDEELLRSLHVEQSDVGIIAQGESLEASVLATLVLKRLGIPWVVAKAASHLHGELLRRIGADQVVFPERDAGSRLAHSLGVRHINDYISLTATTGVAKLTAPPHLIGQTLSDIHKERKVSLSVLLIRRGQTLVTAPSYSERIQEGDELVLAGSDAAIDAFANPDRRAIER